MPKCDFNKVAKDKITLRYGCFPVYNICCIFSVHFFLRTFLRAFPDSYWLIFDYWHIAHKPSTKNTALNTVVSPNFLVRKFCGEAQKFRAIRLCLSTKFPHQEIRWNYGTLCSGTSGICNPNMNYYFMNKYQSQQKFVSPLNFTGKTEKLYWKSMCFRTLLWTLRNIYVGAFL